MIAANLAEVITAIGTAVAAILAGTATLIAALNRRTAKTTEMKVDTTNGTTLGATVNKIQGEIAEQRPLIEWARIKRAQELGAPKEPTPEDIHNAESMLHGDKL